jgi:hypothetical protein
MISSVTSFETKSRGLQQNGSAEAPTTEQETLALEAAPAPDANGHDS